MPRVIDVKALLGTILSAGLLILSYPQIEWAPLAWLAFVPLLLLTHGTSCKSAFVWWYFGGVLFFFGTVGWFVYVTPLGAVVLILYLSLYFGAFGLAFKFFQSLPLRWRLVVLPAVWVVLEFIRAHLISGFGWVMLGHSQYQNLLLIQIADLTGAYGVSGIVILVNILVFESVRGSDRGQIRRALVAVAVIIFLVLGYGFWKVASVPAWPTLNIGVVQPDIAQELKWDQDLQPWVVQKTIGLSQTLAADKLDLIVWPETSLPGEAQKEPELMGAIKLAARNMRTPFLIGAVTEENGKYYNSAYLISDQGQVRDRYDKIHLVPFGEYIPLRPVLGWINRFVPLEDFTPGTKYTLITPRADSKPFGVLICFEDTVTYVRRNFVRAGAAFLVNMTNDAWFLDTKAPFLHLQAAVFGCVENKRSLVRAANTGFSGFVDPLGRILAAVQDHKHKKTFVCGTAVARVPMVEEQTFYTKYGDVFTWACFFVILGAVIFRQRIFHLRISHPLVGRVREGSMNRSAQKGDDKVARKILVIDDDPGVHLLIGALLTKEGYEVLRANTGEEGLHLALSHRPRLIILDVIMPGIKGRDLCVKIKAYEVLKNIPVIFLTAKNSPEEIQAEMAAGGLTHLTKPIEPEKFLNVVKSAVS